MPARADWEAATPRCDRMVDQGPQFKEPGHVCGQALDWCDQASFLPAPTNDDHMLGVWICRAHGLVLDGEGAALRAGYLVRVEVVA